MHFAKTSPPPKQQFVPIPPIELDTFFQSVSKEETARRARLGDLLLPHANAALSLSSHSEPPIANISPLLPNNALFFWFEQVNFPVSRRLRERAIVVHVELRYYRMGRVEFPATCMVMPKEKEIPIVFADSSCSTHGEGRGGGGGEQ